MSRIGKTWNIVGLDINGEQVSDCNKFYHEEEKNSTDVPEERNATADIIDHVEERKNYVIF